MLFLHPQFFFLDVLAISLDFTFKIAYNTENKRDIGGVLIEAI